MIIRGWQIDGFGHFRDQRSPELAPGLSVLHGPNEAGKSTLLAFVRGVLFGFPDKRSKGRQPLYEPPGGGAFGGSVIVEQDGRRYQIHRRAGSRNNRPTITDADGQSVPEGELPQILGGADETLFRNVFGFSLWELQEGDSLTEEGVRDRIFSGAVAGAGKSARQAADQLETAAKALYSPSGRHKKNRAAELFDEIKTIDAELAEAKRAARDYPQKVEAERAAQDDVERLGREMKSSQARRDELQRLLDLWPRWGEREQALGELARRTGRSFPRERPVEPDGELDRLQQRCDELRESLELQRDRLKQAQDLATALESERDRLARALEALGEGWTAERVAAFTMAIPEAETVREWETALAEADRQVEKAQDAHAQAERRLEESQQRHAKLARELQQAEDPPPDLATLQTRNRDLEALRGRTAELARARAHAHAAEQTSNDAQQRVDDQRASQPGRAGYVVGLALAAVLVAAGAVLAGTGELAAGAVVAAVGAAVGAGLAGWTWRRRQAAARRIAAAAAELDRRRQRAADARQTAERIESELAAAAQALGFSGIPGEGELARAASDLANQLERRRRLDSLAREVEEQRADAQARERDRDRAAESLDARRSERRQTLDDWVAWKRARGFPEHLSAQGVRDFARQVQDAQESQRKARESQSRLDQLTHDIAIWEDAAREVLKARGVDGAPAGEPLILAFNEAAAAVRHEQGLLQTALRTEDDIRRAAGHDDARARTLRETLAAGDADTWQRELEEVQGWLDARQAERDEALRRQQDASQARKEVEASDRIAELETRRNQLAGEVADVYRQWQVYTAARILIEQTLERFERERQPAVFARASERLAAFSHGRYTEIRQAGEQGQEFAVIDAEGRTVQPIDLSRGTREQLYLAVRLGLIEEFAQRGTSLPLVLDEILVNFDPDRMAAVAAELARFAEDHQVLLFTCHPEIAERVQANAAGAASIPMTELAAG